MLINLSGFAFFKIQRFVFSGFCLVLSSTVYLSVLSLTAFLRTDYCVLFASYGSFFMVLNATNYFLLCLSVSLL